MTGIPTRPAWNHTQVKEAAALEIMHDVNHWAQMAGLEDFASNEREFKALVALAVIESADSYAASRYLEDFYQWPADRELVNILDRAYQRMKFIAKEHVHNWVMMYNIRFPAKKGEGVRVRIGDLEFLAKVIEVIRPEAKGVIRAMGGNQKNLIVSAEEVLEVVELKESPRPPNGGPTGGTPVAGRATPEEDVA